MYHFIGIYNIVSVIHHNTQCYGFFGSFRIFFSDNTRVRIFIHFVAQSANFFPEFNIRLYDKNSESDYFFFPPPKSEYFFQQHWESEYFFRKKHNPHPLQVKWSFPYIGVAQIYKKIKGKNIHFYYIGK